MESNFDVHALCRCRDIRKASSYMFTVKFTFSEPFAIVPVTPSHLHILILLLLVIMGGYSNHLYLDKCTQLTS